jgi:hypothetical protein
VDGVRSAPFVSGVGGVSYAPPLVFGVELVAPLLVWSPAGTETVTESLIGGTQGGTTFVLRGSQFGSHALLGGPLPPGSVTYSPRGLYLPPYGLQPMYPATNCTITEDHVELTCAMVAGVGADLQFQVTVAGQSSALPRTAYRGPRVDALRVTLAAAYGDSTAEGSATSEQRLWTSGGDTLVFDGDYFGPPSPPLPIVASGQRAGGGPLVTTANCVVPGEGHTRVVCNSPPGSGSGFTWTLSVAGQRSNPAPTSTSYSPPIVTAITVDRARVDGANDLMDEPGMVPTAGDATVTLHGANFGARLDLVSVVWDGVPVPNLLLTEAHTTLRFPSPPGPGGTANVSIVVDGQTTTSWRRGGSNGTTEALSLPYSPPRVSTVRLYQGGAGSTIDCTSVGPDGRPGGEATTGRVALQLRGRNFGNGAGATTVTVGGDPCEVLADLTTHDRIVCWTGMCTGRDCVPW